MRTLVALFAACVIVLQVAVSSWAAGAMAAPPLLDVFGNAICLSDGHDGPAGGHPGMPDCCKFGCNLSSGAIGATGIAGAFLPRKLSVSAGISGAFDAALLTSPDHDPGSPRAPPLTA